MDYEQIKINEQFSFSPDIAGMKKFNETSRMSDFNSTTIESNSQAIFNKVVSDFKLDNNMFNI